jgi:outer membrane lipopolysaccharide assembly protein LptE/RlpB
MTKRLLLVVLTLASLGLSGCLFHRKGKAKDPSDIATETEVDFKQRWISHRVGELTAQGVDASGAQQQAQREFNEKYPYAAPKAK